MMFRLSFYWCFARAHWRHFWSETLPWKLAYLLPRKVALFAFVRVYAGLGECGDDYGRAYQLWEQGQGR